MDDVIKRCCVAGCRAYPLGDFPAKNQHAAAIMLMILNNLDPAVAQFPQELVTYGGNGQVFSNWAQVSAEPAKQTGEQSRPRIYNSRRFQPRCY
jgi:hypothetical protein